MRCGLASKVKHQLARLRRQEERIYKITDIIEADASSHDKVKAIEELLDTFTDLFRIEQIAPTGADPAKEMSDEK